MALGSLNVTHNFTGETGYIIAVLVKSTAPLTEIERVVYPAPHSQQTHLFEGLQPVWHLIRFWRSSDGVALDEEILTLAGNARSGAIYSVTRYEYVVDRGESDPGVWADPVQDDTGLRDTRLYNNVYWVEERGTGSLLTTEIIDRTDLGGGFDFVDANKKMESGGVYVVTVVERVDISGDSDSGSFIGEGVFILDEDQDYSNNLHSGKVLIADFSTTVGTLTIQNLLLVPDGEFTLQTHGGLQRNVVIQLDAGDTVNFRKQAVNKIILGEGEQIKIMFLDNVMYVLDPVTNHFRLGQRIWADFILQNTIAADGGLRVLADYPRADELIDLLLAGEVVNETTWQTSQVIDGITTYPNKGKWMREGLNFRPPDMRSMTIKGLSATDGTVTGGRYENQATLAHYHFIANDQDGGTPYLSTNHSTGGNLGYGFNGSNTVPDKYRTSSVGGSQNIVNNIGQYPLICI